MEEKRCLLCNKSYNYKYAMFGRGCLDNIYGELGIRKPSKFVWNKELYLCTKVAWKNHKYFLSKAKKYDLTQKYIALNYLKKMNFDALKDILSTTLNNLAVASSEYGVIKIYDVKIKFETEEGEF